MKENPYKSPGQYGTTFGRRPKPLVGFLLIFLAIPTSLFGAYGVGMGVYKTFFEHGLWVANGLVALSVGAACLVVTFVLFRMATYFKSPGQAADVGEEH